VGIVNNYFWHRSWTYATRPHKTVSTQFPQFVAVSLSALLLNNLLVLLLAPAFNTLLAQAGYGDLLAKLCATGVGLFWNFLANNFWTFSRATKEVRP
jgi:putative flippase GtrA